MLPPKNSRVSRSGRSPLKRLQLPDRNDPQALAQRHAHRRGPDHFPRSLSRQLEDVFENRPRSLLDGVAALVPERTAPQPARGNLEPVQIQIHVSSAPRLLELPRDFLCLRRFALRAQALAQSKQRPAAVREFL